MDSKPMDDREMVINLLVQQRNSLMDQITGLQLRIAKMEPFMPKEPVNDDERKSEL